jgi:hypothetical protein
MSQAAALAAAAAVWMYFPRAVEVNGFAVGPGKVPVMPNFVDYLKSRGGVVIDGPDANITSMQPAGADHMNYGAHLGGQSPTLGSPVVPPVPQVQVNVQVPVGTTPVVTAQHTTGAPVGVDTNVTNPPADGADGVDVTGAGETAAGPQAPNALDVAAGNVPTGDQPGGGTGEGAQGAAPSGEDLPDTFPAREALGTAGIRTWQDLDAWVELNQDKGFDTIEGVDTEAAARIDAEIAARP